MITDKYLVTSLLEQRIGSQIRNVLALWI